MPSRLFCPLVALLICSSLFGQTGQTLTFKGDHLGETVAEFIQHPVIAYMITTCRYLAPKVLTDDQVLKKYWGDAFPVIQLDQDGEQHAQAADDTDIDAYLDRCGALLEILTKGQGTVDGKGYMPGNVYAQDLLSRKRDAYNHRSTGSGNPYISPGFGIPLPHVGFEDEDRFTFENGVLAFFIREIRSPDIRYEDLRNDVTGRVGVPPKISTTPYQNGLGARWENVTCEWATPTIVVILVVDNNPVEPKRPFLKVGTPAYLAKQASVRKPNPLDVP